MCRLPRTGHMAAVPPMQQLPSLQGLHGLRAEVGAARVSDLTGIGLVSRSQAGTLVLLAAPGLPPQSPLGNVSEVSGHDVGMHASEHPSLAPGTAPVLNRDYTRHQPLAGPQPVIMLRVSEPRAHCFGRGATPVGWQRVCSPPALHRCRSLCAGHGLGVLYHLPSLHGFLSFL